MTDEYPGSGPDPTPTCHTDPMPPTLQHGAINARMCLETTSLLLLFGLVTGLAHSVGSTAFVGLGIVAQGIWLQRVYCVGHEASHQKLYPTMPRVNDVIGQLFLWLILVPLPVFRQIHRFHHGANRRDERTSALDIFCVRHQAGILQKISFYALWYFAVLGCGWFLHGLFSLLLFVLLPTSLARRVSPAFRGWNSRKQRVSLALFGFPIIVHGLAIRTFGMEAWYLFAGGPLVVFAWVYSVQLYVYHYRTTVGSQTLMHARRLQGGPVLRWWLLNLNEHDTHHRRPHVPWYRLPAIGVPLPDEFRKNQNVSRFTSGLIQQLRGPTIIENKD